MSHQTVSALTVHEALKTDTELAFLDVREHGVHSQGHPLFAVPVPLSQFELNIARLVPRISVTIYLMDQGGGDDLALRAARILKEMGYTYVSVLENGIYGWQEAGYEIFSGVNVPSKAFGEFVEHTYSTPYITAEQLQGRLDAGEKITILDSRPYAEYHRMCIPGGIDMPGAELVNRVFQNIPDETTPIVVNCAGRTRSIIGAQSLINAGVKNPVMALKDGTMGWYLSGYTTENGADRIAPPPTGEMAEKSAEAAEGFAKEIGVSSIEKQDLEQLQAQSNEKTLFLLDVRTEEEFLEGHIFQSQHAPGGQLVQATDEYVGVRGATLVLIDDKKVRALMTASWLKQLGAHHVHVLSCMSDFELEAGPAFQVDVQKASEVNALELDAVIHSGEPIAVIDLSSSLRYRKGHIPNAFWAIRSRLGSDLSFLPPVGLVILTADDVRVAHLAAAEVVATRPEVIVRVLEGGNAAWKNANLKMEVDDTYLLSKADDIWYKPYDNKDKIRERMQEYLDWETALVSQIERDGTAKFKTIDELAHK
ncbi:MAG: rhodanese-like domain-containing protein [Pseudomonas marincola]